MTVNPANSVETPQAEIQRLADPVQKPPSVAAHSDSATISDAAKTAAKLAGN